jgi:hypothetical protein
MCCRQSCEGRPGKFGIYVFHTRLGDDCFESIESLFGHLVFRVTFGDVCVLDVYFVESLFGTSILSSDIPLSAPAMIDSAMQQAMPSVQNGAQD